MTDSLLAKAVAAKQQLESARNEANEDNARHLLEKTLPFQIALDLIVQELDAGGYSKSKIADSLGESRTTIYQRMERIAGEGIKAKVKSPSNTKMPMKITESSERYKLSEDDKRVKVIYDQFGPSGISGEFEFALMQDDDDSVWLMADTDATSPPEVAIVDVLDAQFTGFYYDDFAKWAEKEFEND